MNHFARAAAVSAATLLAALPSVTSAHPLPTSRLSTIAQQRLNKPVLAFYYSWYHPSTFSLKKMSDIPSTPYESSDPSTIQRQIKQAAQSGITGFAASWTGPGAGQENRNFAQVLQYAGAYQKKTGMPFEAAVYLETDLLSTYGNTLAGSIQYAMKNYTSNPNYFTWKGRPVLFFWDPFGQGRTLATWAKLRQQLDPKHKTIWMIDSSRPYASYLGTFDGYFVFSALYWCLPPRATTIASCDQTFRTGLDTYNQLNGTDKIWAAPAQPGYNDIRLRGTTIGYTVPRSNGATYKLSWQGAISSSPDWVMVTTYNEWFEGTMIEPSKTYGTKYLSLTQTYAGQWRKSS